MNEFSGDVYKQQIKITKGRTNVMNLIWNDLMGILLIVSISYTIYLYLEDK